MRRLKSFEECIAARDPHHQTAETQIGPIQIDPVRIQRKTTGLAYPPKPNCALTPPMKVASSCADRAAMYAAASAPAV